MFTKFPPSRKPTPLGSPASLSPKPQFGETACRPFLSPDKAALTAGFVSAPTSIGGIGLQNTASTSDPDLTTSPGYHCSAEDTPAAATATPLAPGGWDGPFEGAISQKSASSVPIESGPRGQTQVRPGSIFKYATVPTASAGDAAPTFAANGNGNKKDGETTSSLIVLEIKNAVDTKATVAKFFGGIAAEAFSVLIRAKEEQVKLSFKQENEALDNANDVLACENEILKREKKALEGELNHIKAENKEFVVAFETMNSVIGHQAKRPRID